MRVRLNLGNINLKGLAFNLFASLLTGAVLGGAAAINGGHSDPKSIAAGAGAGILPALLANIGGFFTQRTDKNGDASPFPSLESTDISIAPPNRFTAAVDAGAALPAALAPVVVPGSADALLALAKAAKDAEKAQAQAQRDAQAAAFLADAQAQADRIRQGVPAVQTTVQPPMVATYPASVPGQG